MNYMDAADLRVACDAEERTVRWLARVGQTVVWRSSRGLTAEEAGRRANAYFRSGYYRGAADHVHSYVMEPETPPGPAYAAIYGRT